MNPSKNLLAAGLLLSLNAATAQATLIDRGNGMIYDQDRDITWLANANQGAGSSYDNGGSGTDGLMTWQNAVNWADTLDYQGYSDWRLPTTLQPDASCDGQSAGDSYGYNCTGSELGHLFYTELGGTASSQIGNSHNGFYDLFSNVQDYAYWSGSEFAPDPLNAWGFLTLFGIQTAIYKNNESYAWAVRSGDVAANSVPEPGSLALFGLGLMALRRVRRR